MFVYEIYRTRYQYSTLEWPLKVARGKHSSFINIQTCIQLVFCSNPVCVTVGVLCYSMLDKELHVLFSKRCDWCDSCATHFNRLTWWWQVFYSQTFKYLPVTPIIFITVWVLGETNCNDSLLRENPACFQLFKESLKVMGNTFNTLPPTRGLQ